MLRSRSVQVRYSRAALRAMVPAGYQVEQRGFRDWVVYCGGRVVAERVECERYAVQRAVRHSQGSQV